MAPSDSSAASRNHRSFATVILVGALVGLLIYIGWMWHRIRFDPTLAFLSSSSSAEWIQHDEPVSLETHGTGKVARGFKTRFAVSATPSDTGLRLRAMKRVNVIVDGKVIAAPSLDALQWKSEQILPLAPHLSPGEHELIILVENENGPAVLWASSKPLDIRTDASWQSSADGVNWRAARPASDHPAVPMAGQFESPLQALGSRWPIFGVVFLLVGGATWVFGNRPRPPPFGFRPAIVRWAVLVAWAVMAANNILKLPAPAGFDVGGHLDYVSYLLKNHRIPLATDGWQMFQSPFVYLIGAPLYLMLAKLFAPGTAVLLLRILPLACGLLQIELCYRALRRVFSQRADLQILGTLFAGFLPMNIYLSQYFGNEPLAGMLSSAIFVLSLKLIQPDGSENVRWTPWWLGVLFGLALLAKVSAVLVGFPLLIAIAWRSLSSQPSITTGIIRAARTTGVVFGLTAVVAGWYYVRNYIHLGRPFVGGWDLSRGIAWWQDPGYRVASEFLTFGPALVRPVYVGLEGFWDGFYATYWCDSDVSSAVALAAVPPWNHGYMMAGVLLALAPSLALGTGIVVAVRNAVFRAEAVWLIALACIAVYVFALLHHALTLPYYCAIKAFYTIGAMPAYALVAVAGFDFLTRVNWSRALVYGLMACWVVSVYVAYFART